MRYRILGMMLLISTLAPDLLLAQFWTEVDPSDIPAMGKRDIEPQYCMTYMMDHETMKHKLWSAPHEYAQMAGNSPVVITVGLANGTADLFRIVQYEMMEAYLAARYTGIKTFRGISISNPYRTIRIDWTLNGFRAVVRDLDGLTYIDPYQRNDLSHRIVYRKNDFHRDIVWTCGVEEADFGRPFHQPRSVGDCEFRSYRLAVATTGEYSNYFGAFSSSQSGLVLSQVVTAVNRVNDVYEADFSTRLLLIANTDDVFYYSPGGDPYSGSACNHLGQNQTTMTNVIGSANYDIGHVFSVGSGGCAGLGVICSSSNKARGATGLNPPTGDPFYIDYVAHELGHQFGANHTQNNNCNRNNPTALEPGSASTIMGYAGICSPNVQNNSDPYMHGISLVEIANVIGSTTCEAIISTSNSGPSVSNVPNYTIPISTPFVLTAIATDPEGNPMTYCWEQWDHEVGTMPPQPTNTLGPMFRSLLPSSSPSRYFPNLAAIIAGQTPTWEVLPSVGRTMEFRVTVRDLYDGTFGCTGEDNVIITTTATSGPFTVTSQNTTTVWLEGEDRTITWNVANTTASPVNCSHVDIKLSYDGGYTYPVTLSANETNDGSATVSIPPGTTTQGRIMVIASNNVFFDINNAHITINPGLPNFTMALEPAVLVECNQGSVMTTVEVGQFMGFTDPVTLSILNLPPGANAQFVPQVVIPGSTSTLTISNLSGLFGTYIPVVRGTSTTGPKDVNFSITLLAPPADAPILVSPANNMTDEVITPLLDWQSVAGITQYEYQVAYNNTFTSIALSGIALTDQYQVSSPLATGQQFYWRTRAINSCSGGEWSTVYSFTTGSCFALQSSDVPVTIPSSGTPTVYSDFPIGIDMSISDVNVIKLTGTHTWVDDLRFTLIAPDNSERIIWDRPCGNHDNFNINLDDEAANSNWPCPPTDGLTYKPDNSLSFFDGKNTSGLWRLKIQDLVNQDGGILNSWGLKVCGEINCQLIVNQTTGTGAGTLPAAIACAVSGDTIWLSAQLAGQTIDIGGSPVLLNKNLVILSEGAGIRVTGTGERVFEIPLGVSVGLHGITVVAAMSASAGAILSAGILTLTESHIEANPGMPGAVLVRQDPGGILNINGICTITE